MHAHRDQAGTFEAQLIKKHQRCLEGFRGNVLARRDLARHPEPLARPLRHRVVARPHPEGHGDGPGAVSRVAEPASLRALGAPVPRRERAGCYAIVRRTCTPTAISAKTRLFALGKVLLAHHASGA